MDTVMSTCWGPDFEELWATDPEMVARAVRTGPAAAGGTDELARSGAGVTELVAAFPAYLR